jgi:hypothetical protein
MFTRLRARHLRILCLAVVAFTLCCVCPAAPSNGPSEFLLRVVSARYIPDKNEIQYKLQNDGHSSVSAYSVDVAVVSPGAESTELGDGFSTHEDLLTSELFLQCRNSPENADDEDARPWGDELLLPEGLMLPGKVRVRSIGVPSSLDQNRLSAKSSRIRVVVAGVIWSDGRIEGTPNGVGDMQRIRDLWNEVDRETKPVLRILKANAENANDQNWINRAIERLEALTKGYPREVPVPEDESARTMYVAEPSAVTGMIRELDEVAYLPNPKARITFETEMQECAMKRRAELQVPARTDKPARTASDQRVSAGEDRRRFFH